MLIKYIEEGIFVSFLFRLFFFGSCQKQNRRTMIADMNERSAIDMKSLVRVTDCAAALVYGCSLYHTHTHDTYACSSKSINQNGGERPFVGT